MRSSTLPERCDSIRFDVDAIASEPDAVERRIPCAKVFNGVEIATAAFVATVVLRCRNLVWCKSDPRGRLAAMP